jgi:hypothetical protein
LQQARATRPFVLGAQHLDRQFGRIGVSWDAVLVEIFGGHLDITSRDATIGFTKPLASISFFTSTMLRANTIGGMNLRKAASRAGGIDIRDRPLSMPDRLLTHCHARTMSQLEMVRNNRPPFRRTERLLMMQLQFGLLVAELAISSKSQFMRWKYLRVRNGSERNGILAERGRRMDAA